VITGATNCLNDLDTGVACKKQLLGPKLARSNLTDLPLSILYTLTVDRFTLYFYSILADGDGGRGNILRHVKRGNCQGGECPGGYVQGEFSDPVKNARFEHVRQRTCLSLS